MTDEPHFGERGMVGIECTDVVHKLTRLETRVLTSNLTPCAFDPIHDYVLNAKVVENQTVSVWVPFCLMSGVGMVYKLRLRLDKMTIKFNYDSTLLPGMTPSERPEATLTITPTEKTL